MIFGWIWNSHWTLKYSLQHILNIEQFQIPLVVKWCYLVEDSTNILSLQCISHYHSVSCIRVYRQKSNKIQRFRQFGLHKGLNVNWKEFNSVYRLWCICVLIPISWREITSFRFDLEILIARYINIIVDCFITTCIWLILQSYLDIISVEINLIHIMRNVIQQDIDLLFIMLFWVLIKNVSRYNM